MRRLIRESAPPAGQLASPVPQYWNPNTEAFEDVLGAHGAPRAILYGPNGQPIGSNNPLPVADSALAQAVAQLATEGKLEEARALLETISQKDFATQTTLSEVLQRLEAIEEQLETGDAKVQLKGRIVETVLPRQIRTSSSGALHIYSPSWARGVIIRLVIYASSGVFDENQGASLEVSLVNTPGMTNIRSFRKSTDPKTALGNIQDVVIYPGVGDEDLLFSGEKRVYKLGIPTPHMLRVILRISGTFDAGQGVDCEVTATWIG